MHGQERRLILRCISSLTLVLMSLCISRSVNAQYEEALDEARERYERGVGLYSAGSLETALAEFRRAYEIAPNFAILYVMGRIDFELERWADAFRSLRRYLDEGGERIPDTRRQEVERRLSELREFVGYVRVSLEHPDAADLYIDDVNVGRIPSPDSNVVTTGDHVIEVRAAGFLQHRAEVAIASDETEEMSVSLIPSELPGGIHVSAIPGATVTFDGEAVGSTPLEYLLIRPGRADLSG